MNAITSGACHVIDFAGCILCVYAEKDKIYNGMFIGLFYSLYSFLLYSFLSSSQHKVKENSYCRHLSLMRTVINESNIQYFYGYGFNVFGDSAMGDRILAYGENGDASSNVLFSSGTLRRLFFFGLIIYSIDKIEVTERLKQIILWGAFLSIVTYLLFSQIGYFSIRLSAYYRIIECIWLSYFPFIFKNHRSQMIVIAFFFLYSILQVSSALMLEDNGLLPIRTIVFEDL